MTNPLCQIDLRVLKSEHLDGKTLWVRLTHAISNLKIKVLKPTCQTEPCVFKWKC